MRKNILLVLITSIICISGTVYATYVYRANDISYVPSDENWNVTNVEDAINNLKSDVSNINRLNALGDILYPAETIDLVALVSNDSYYKDSEDYFILANSDTGRSLLTDTETYKTKKNDTSVKGKVGSEKVVELDDDSNTFPKTKTKTKRFKFTEFQTYACSGCSTKIEDDKITLTGGGPSYVPPDGAIVYVYADVTDYKSFKFKTSRDTTSGRMYGLVSDNKPETYGSFSGFNQAVYVSDTTAETLFTIDVSNLTGYKYIAVYHRGSNTYVKDFYLSQ